MSVKIPSYRPVEKGASLVDNEAFQHYRKFSKIRDPKKFNYHTDYKKIIRKIYKKIVDSSIEYESGVYVKNMWYIIPQVVCNKPFVIKKDGSIKTNHLTKGDMYGIIFCNIMKKYNHFCWSLDGCFVRNYRERVSAFIMKNIPKYYFILPTILKNKL